MRRNGRYRIKRVPFEVASSDPWTEEPYGLWDSWDRVFVNKYGEPDPTYYTSRAVAIMRRRDLNLGLA